jgi:ubiquinone/menaquinone biosynthesis C-methylase UbiE
MNKSDTWDFISSEYDADAQELTGPCIVKLLEQVSLLPVTSSTRSIKGIELASGPGILATLLGEAYSRAGYLENVTFLSTDFSPKMVELAERRFASRNWPSSQFSARTLDATHLVDVPSDHYTHAFCTFGLMMIPDASKALDEMFRVLEPSGTIGITTWHKVGWFPFFSECVARAKASSKKEEKATPSLPIAANWSAESYVRTVLENAGFQNIVVSIFETPWLFANQDEFVKQLTQSRWITPIIQNANLTDEQRDKYNQVVHQVLLDLVNKDRSQPFDIPMVAIIAHGQKPSQ